MSAENEKKPYTPIEIDIVVFDTEDVLTISEPETDIY